MARGMVSGIYVDLEKQAVLLVENANPKKPPGWGLPGGRITKYDKTPKSALLREWEEETGTKALNVELFLEMERQRKYIHYFFIVGKIDRNLRTTGVPNETGPPKWIPLEKIATRKMRIYWQHLNALYRYLCRRLAIKNINAAFIAAKIARNYNLQL